jgi:hypothetical protein
MTITFLRSYLIYLSCSMDTTINYFVLSLLAFFGSKLKGLSGS